LDFSLHVKDKRGEIRITRQSHDYTILIYTLLGNCLDRENAIYEDSHEESPETAGRGGYGSRRLKNSPPNPTPPG
jgi:hypothetical protein